MAIYFSRYVSNTVFFLNNIIWSVRWKIYIDKIVSSLSRFPRSRDETDHPKISPFRSPSNIHSMSILCAKLIWNFDLKSSGLKIVKDRILR